MIDIEQTLTNSYPDFFQHQPYFFKKGFFKVLRTLFKEDEVNRFLEKNQGIEGLDFVEKVLDYFDFSYQVSSKERENIPVQGRMVIIANHPLGVLDALALMKLISEVRRDVLVVANDLLNRIEPLQSLILPVDDLRDSAEKSEIKQIIKALLQEKAVIIFPAEEVSRARPSGVEDGKWQDRFLRVALRAEAPILPIYISARNSSLFYAVSMIYKPLAGLMLVQEMFRQRSKTISFKVNEQIPYENLQLHGVKRKAQARLLKRHFCKVAKEKKGIFETERAIAHPEPRQELRNELFDAERLGETSDGKAIFLVDYHPDSAIMDEIGRLREVTFRRVGEGSGQRRDFDRYDQYYRHLVLWDEHALEVVGAYRIGEVGKIVGVHGMKGLYTHSLFRFDDAFQQYVSSSLELGRSFVQPNYWGSRALDYLWQGIGVYLRHHSQIRYMFGPVTISRYFPGEARDLLVSYCLKHYGAKTTLVSARSPLRMSNVQKKLNQELLCGEDAAEDFGLLKDHLSRFGVTVPALYKQYTDLCEDGGVHFHAFGIDHDFANCVDGFIMVDLSYVKAKKRARYIGD